MPSQPSHSGTTVLEATERLPTFGAESKDARRGLTEAAQAVVPIRDVWCVAPQPADSFATISGGSGVALILSGSAGSRSTHSRVSKPSTASSPSFMS